MHTSSPHMGGTSVIPYLYFLQVCSQLRNVTAKWKKVGYENLCYFRCIEMQDMSFGTNCICKVPKSKLEEGRIVEYIHIVDVRTVLVDFSIKI